MTKGELAKKLFEDGYNCAQAVLLAFCEDFGMDRETAMMISAPFGGGMGRLREVCGTVSGMNMVLGLAKKGYQKGDNASKAQLYKDVQTLAEKFREDNGSIICRELLNLRIEGKDNHVPELRTEKYYKARPCSELCRYAADLLEEHLELN
ncbi:MAG: C-GCAxxG-C-C family protein [Ruminococcus sp.]|nr:C-GCAxxG-C-C family protein [Ruminococcus sp.]